MRVTDLLIGALLGGGSLAAQSLEPRLHDLRGLLRIAGPGLNEYQREPFVLPTILPLPHGEDAGIESSTHWVLGALGRSADSEALVSWLEGALHLGGDPGIVRIGALRAGRVMVEADPAVHVRFARRIADLEAAGLRPLSVELVRIPGSSLATDFGRDDPEVAVLDDAAVTALLAAHEPLGIWRADARTGVPIVLRAGLSRRYLRDAEVEVAGEAEVFDPKMDVMKLGLLATLQVARAASGGVFVTCALRRCDAPLQVPTVETEHAELQMPPVDVELHEFRTRLRGDGAIVLGALGDRASAWLVRVRGTGGTRPDAVPLGGVEDVPWSLAQIDRQGAFPLRFPGEDFGEPGPGELPAELPAELTDAMSGHDSAEEVPGIVLGDAWIVARESAATSRVRAIAAAYAAGTPVAIRYAVAVVDATGAARVPVPDQDASDAARSAGVQGVLPSRTGDAVVAAIGTERAFVADHDVEIAQGASVANPIVDTWFDGLMVGFVASTSADGAFRVRGSAGVQRSADGPTKLDPRAYDRGPIDAPRVEHVRIAFDVVLPAAAWRCVGVEAIGTSGAHVAVFVRIDG